MGGGRSSTVSYQAPKIEKDDTFARYLSYQQEREAAAERRAAEEAAWTDGVKKGRDAIEKKLQAVRKAMGVRKNEPNPAAICEMKERMEFEMMCALRKEVLGK